MIVSINQPAYLPWLGYFDRIVRSDIHVVLDHVQFEKNSFTNRNKIRTKEGSAWLTIPLSTKGKFGNLEIRNLEFASGGDWERKHWASLRTNYTRTPFFALYGSAYEKIYAGKPASFMAFVVAMLEQQLSDLRIATKILFSSQIPAVGHKSELILSICKFLGASVYLSGSQGRSYLDERAFYGSRIGLKYQDYKHPEYRQAWPGFESQMGILDLLFNHGPNSLKILMNDQTQKQ